MAKMDVKGTEITVITRNEDDFISLTDMLKAKDGDFFISDWLRNRNTVEFLGKIESFLDLNIGDYVVHENSGVGRYTGIEQITG